VDKDRQDEVSAFFFLQYLVKRLHILYSFVRANLK